MCAALELNEQLLRPGGFVCVWAESGGLRVVWAGFARKESLGWWRRKGAELVDVPATRFAERSDRTRELLWDDVPPGLVSRGLLDRSGKWPLLKVVTRAGTNDEIARFEHARMPVLEAPIHSAAPVPVETLPPLPEAAAGGKRANRRAELDPARDTGWLFPP